MKFPSRECPQEKSRVNSLHLRDRGSQGKLTLQSPSVQNVKTIHPESLANFGEKACDWLVEIYIKVKGQIVLHEQIYVELKSKHHLHDAIDQLEATIKRFDPDLRKYPKRSYVVGTFSKPSTQKRKLADKVFQQKYRSYFYVVPGGKHMAAPLLNVGGLMR